MRSVVRWWQERRLDHDRLCTDAISYRSIRKDIADLQAHAQDFPEILAVLHWLARSDDLRRWRPGDQPVCKSQWWAGNAAAFTDQFRAQFRRRRRP